ncbi:recombinase family protein [Lachnospiraceae bacterium]|nr:recombinase family protein [Lachnospiraceae bacterium]
MDQKLRAVYYCRVSTDDENQATSITNQKEESINVIKENHWELIDGYVDEGKSGTTTKKRTEYNRLFKDMETDKFDIIVIKSQDRLMRNTKEWYFFIDKLVQYNKKLYFYLERKFYSPDDALITGIKAILAEDYSRSLSKNINNAHRKRQETGSNVVITSKTWGYDKINKTVVINEKEAEMVRFIYEMAVQNHGSRTIAKMLQDYGYYNHDGNKIAEQTVRRIIRNPLYKGTAVMNVFHKNFETKRTERNSQDKWIYHDHIVPAIVSEELWDQANKLMDKRSQKVITEDFKTKITGSKKNITPLTSKIECGLCQNVFWRSTSVTVKTPKVYWNCREYVQRGRKTKNARSPKGEKKSKYNVADSGCDNIHIKESDMDHLIYELAQKIYARSKNNILSVATSILRQIMDDTSELDHQEKVLNDELYKMKSSREILLDKYLEGKIEDDIYSIKDSNLKDQMMKLEDELKMLYNKKSTISDKENRFHDLENELEAIADYDLSVDNMKNHIEKVIVYPSYMMFYFDIFDSVKVEIEKINYRKMEFHICL